MSRFSGAPSVPLELPTFRLAVYRLSDGAFAWDERDSGQIYGLLAAEGDVVYRVDNRVIRRRMADGELIWETTLPDWMGTNLLWEKGVLLVGSGSGYLHALDPATGFVFWSQDLWADLASHPLFIWPVAVASVIVAWVDGPLTILRRKTSASPSGKRATVAPMPTPTPTPTIVTAGLWTPVAPPPPGYTPTPPPPYLLKGDLNTWHRAYVRAIAEILHITQGNPDRFRQTLLAWAPDDSGLKRATENAWVQVTDIDNDGQAEWLAAVPLVQQFCYEDGCRSVTFCSGSSCRYQVLLFERMGDAFVPVHRFPGIQKYPAQALTSPRVLAVDDINRDGRKEVVLLDEERGRIDSFFLYVGQWDGQTWHDLAPGGIWRANVKISLSDRDGDGVQEIVLYGGIVGTVWMALQRPHTWVYRWQNGTYQLAEDIPDPNNHAYFLVVDANAALARGDWDQALSLAQRALTGGLAAGESWDWAPVLEARLRTYAAIEAMLVYSLRHETGAMHFLLRLVETRYDHPQNPYADAARTLWRVYQATQDPYVACQAMARIVRNRRQQTRFQAWLTEAEALSFDQFCPL